MAMVVTAPAYDGPVGAEAAVVIKPAADRDELLARWRRGLTLEVAAPTDGGAVGAESTGMRPAAFDCDEASGKPSAPPVRAPAGGIAFAVERASMVAACTDRHEPGRGGGFALLSQVGTRWGRGFAEAVAALAYRSAIQTQSTGVVC